MRIWAALALPLWMLAAKDYSGYQVLRVELFDRRDFRVITQWATQHPEHVDVWRAHKERMDVMVSGAFRPRLQRHLARRRLPHRVIIPDVQALMDRTSSLGWLRRRRLRRSRRRKFLNLAEFHGVDAINGWLWGLPQQSPGLARVHNLSKSFEGRDIVLVKLGRAGADAVKKPAIWVDGGMHAREWLAPAAALFLIKDLLRRFGQDRSVTWLLDTYDVYVLPVLNPDGYAFSRSARGKRFWRKTRSEPGKRRRSRRFLSCRGVDLNRNFDHHWGRESLSRFPCDETYAGPDSFSEPESAAMRHFVLDLLPELKLYISLHAYGQLFLSPWGSTMRLDILRPDDYVEHRDLALHALGAIKATTNATYEHGTIAGDMYAASGTSVDYFYSKGVKFTYAVELPPTEDDLRGFLVGPREILRSGREMSAAIQAMAEALADLDSDGRVRTSQS